MAHAARRRDAVETERRAKMLPSIGEARSKVPEESALARRLARKCASQHTTRRIQYPALYTPRRAIFRRPAAAPSLGSAAAPRRGAYRLAAVALVLVRP